MALFNRRQNTSGLKNLQPVNYNATLYIIITTVIASLAVHLQISRNEGIMLARTLFGDLALWPTVFHENAYWQFFSHFFVVPRLLSLAFEMLFLWIIGSTLEAQWGTKRYLQFLAICMAGSIAMWFFLVYIAGEAVLLFGPGAALVGFIWVFSREYPEQQFYLFFVLPLKAKYFLFIYIGLHLLLGGRYGVLLLLMELGGGGLAVLIHYLRDRLPELQQEARMERFQAKAESEDEHLRKKNQHLHEYVRKGLDSSGEARKALTMLQEKTEKPVSVEMCPDMDFEEEDKYCLECEGYPYCLQRRYEKKLEKKAEKAE